MNLLPTFFAILCIPIVHSTQSLPNADSTSLHRQLRQVAPRRAFNVVNTTSPTGEIRSLHWRLVEHRDGKVILKSYLVYDPLLASVQNPQPAIMVVHDWDGRDAFENTRAEALARAGYVGYAVDMFGRQGGRPWLNDRLVAQFRKNRGLFLKRLQMARDELTKLAIVDKERIGAIGYSFGALGALDIARAGWKLRGVVSFHGTLGAMNSSSLQQVAVNPDSTNMTAKILVLHGYKDRGVTPVQVKAFQQEMTKRKIDWQLQYYSNMTDFFTKPTANVPGRAMYNPVVEKRTWTAMMSFFREVFDD